MALWRRGGVETIAELDALMEQKISRAFEGDAVVGRMEEDLKAWLHALMRTLEGDLTALWHALRGSARTHVPLRNTG